MKELEIKSTTDRKGKKNDLIKVTSGEVFQLFLYEDQELPNNYYAYEWIGKIGDLGTVGYYKGERKILLQLSDIYYGYPLKINLSMTSRSILHDIYNNAISYIYNKKLPIYEHPKQTQRIFFIKCPIEIKEVGFLNYMYQPYQNNTYVMRNNAEGFIHCHIEGLNTKKIKYKLLFNDVVETESYAEINFNNVYIRFKVPDSACNKGVITIVKIDLSIIDFEDYNKLNTDIKKQFNNIFTGYLSVVDTDFYFINTGIQNVLEPVVIGAISIVENNHMPCKFTEITFKEESESKNLFNEASNSFAQFIFDLVDLPWKVLDSTKKKQKKTYTEFSFNKIQPYAIIGGYELKNIDFTIKNFETAKCKVKPKHKSNVFRFDEQEIKLKKSKANANLLDGQLNINYDYSLAEKIFSPWNYFLPQNKKQRHYVAIDSCRHSIKLPIDVYPDVQWVFTLKFELHEGKKAESFSKLFTRDVDPNRTNQKKENKFEIGLGINWNNNTKYSGIKVEPLKLGKILREDPKGIPGVLGGFLKNELYLKFVAWVKSIQEILGFLNMFQDAATFARSLTINELTNDINNQRNKPEIQIIYPKGEMSFSWRAGAYNGNAGMIWEGKCGGTVIGIKATYDMFPLAAKIPQLKVPIAALKFIQWASAGKLKFLFDLVITGQVDLAGKMAKDNAQDKFDSTLEVKASLKLKLVLAGKVKPSVNNKLETRVYGTDVQGGISVSYKFDFEDDGTWGHSEVKLNKLEGSVYTEIEVSDNGNVSGGDEPTSNGISHKGREVLGKFVFIDEILLYKSEKKQWFN